MNNEKGESGGDGASCTDTQKTMSQEEVDALKKCLEENKGDHTKCKSKIDAFQSSSASSPRRPLPRLRLRSGSLTDV